MSETNHNHEPSLVPLDNRHNLSRLLEDSFPMGYEVANFGKDSPGFARLIFSVDEPATTDKADFLNKPFRVVQWHAKKVLVEAEKTGSQEPAVRLTLIDTEGETLSFVSSGAVESFDRIRQIFGDGPYVDGLAINVVPVTTRNRRTMLRLRPAE